MRIAALIAAVGLTGAAALFATGGLSAATSDPEAQSRSAACALEARPEGRMITVTAYAKLPSGANVPGTASYRLSVTGGAGTSKTDISQGGETRILPGERVQLGQLMLSENGIYDALLQVTTGGVTYHCSKTISGRI